jgi:molybdopterin-containing oxidoreductase family iron-sulfur binding subunit
MGKPEDKSTKITRRELFKTGSLAAVAAAAIPKIAKAESAADGKKLVMVIDLQRCTGCGACIVSCKNENNVQAGVNWSYKLNRTVGEFPNVRYEYIPTLCNHCEKAPCVGTCPTGAMHKGYGNITMHTPDACIGCQLCRAACPYTPGVGFSKEHSPEEKPDKSWGVIYFNKWGEETHKFWRDGEALMEGITSTPQEVNQKVKGTVIPYYNVEREKSTRGSGLRYEGIVEKCTFCDHRVEKGELPYCIEACPADARIFGDLNDPKSEVSKILGKYRSFRRKENLGTEPKVFYVRDFNPAHYRRTKGSI